jgi:hypothetical protein
MTNWRTLNACLVMLLVTVAAGCSSPASREAMVPGGVAISKHFQSSVRVLTGGGSETGALDSSNISDADLKLAIEDAIVQSRLFKTVVQGADGDYELSVRITSLTKPVFGATFTVDLETAWSLTRTADRSALMRKSVKSTGTATMGEAFAAVVRLRLAVEKAAQENIGLGLKAIAELNL